MIKLIVRVRRAACAILGVLLLGVTLAAQANPPPVRVALQYWQANDYPDYPIYDWVTITVPGQEVDDWGDDGYGNWVIIGSHWEPEHDETVWEQVGTAADGQFGSSWATSTGIFNINQPASGYSSLTANRGGLVKEYQTGQSISITAWGQAPGGNCNTYDVTLYYPNGTVLNGPTSFSSSLRRSFTPTSGGLYRIEVRYLNATSGANPSSGTATYYISVGAQAPTIHTQPVSATAVAGTDTALSVSASGWPVPTFQWRKNGTNIAGATNALLSLPAVQAVSSGSYSVLVSNSWGQSVTSTTATLTVHTVPTITTQPGSQTVAAGQTATFSVMAAGEPLNFQWLKNGATISGATASTLSLPNVQSADAASYSVVVSNLAGTVTSASATLSVTPSAPSITTQPADSGVYLQQSRTFSVVAIGTVSLSYQWRKNGVAISGATGASYTVSNAQSGDAGAYSVVVTNSVGTVTSATANLTVSAAPPPRLALQYWQANDYPGYPLYDWVTVTVPGQYVDEWGWNEADEWVVIDTHWVPEHDETSWEQVGTIPDGQYGSSWTTTSGTFNINQEASGYSALTASRGGLTKEFLSGQAVSFTAWGYAPGANCNTYEVTLFRPNGTVLSGPTAFSSSVNQSFTSNTTGLYRVEIRYLNATSGTSPASGTVTYYIPIGAQATTIHAPPVDTAVVSGADTALAVSASAWPLPTFQWRRNGINIAGATTALLSLPAVQSISGGSYSVVVSNSWGQTVTSAAATLTVHTVPAIAAQPGNQTVAAGQTATLSVIATGEPLNFQWRKNGATISGATSSALVVATVQSADAASYSVVVSNLAGTVTSASATLSVTPSAPSITTQPADTTVFIGTSRSLGVVAVGTSPLSYQWRKNGVAISGATGASYTVSNAQSGDTGAYSVVVTNSVGTVTSATANLTVSAAPPPRLALQYWQANDYPDFPVYGWVTITVPGQDVDDWGDDGYGNWVIIGSHWEPEHEETVWEQTGTQADGQHGSSWATNNGTFDIYQSGSTYSSTYQHRGILTHSYSLGADFAFRVHGATSNSNCSDYEAKVYNPNGTLLETILFSTPNHASALRSIELNLNGVYTIAIRYLNATGGTTPSSGTVYYYVPVGSVGPQAQSISFASLPGRTVGDAPFTLSATSSSGLPVEFLAASGPISVSGATVTILGHGTAKVRAVQSGGLVGSVLWQAASPVEQTFTITGQAQSITFGTIADRTYGDAPFSITSTASSGLGVVLSASGPATVTGNSVTVTGTGTVTITATQPGNQTFLAATAVVRSFTVAKATQTVSFTAPSDRTLGQLPFSLVASATSGLPVSFSVVSGEVGLFGNTVSPTVAGSVTISAQQPGNDLYFPATAVSRTFTVVADTTAPSSPGSVAATQVSSSAVRVTWSSSTDNIGIDRYEIRRNGVLVGTVGGLSALISGILVQSGDQFSVTARDFAGNVSTAASAVVVLATNADDDADGDGVPRRIEELLGTNPSSPGTPDADQMALRVQKPNP